ncbi:hypothetical protein [Actinophytocola sp. KF-1]
MDKRVFDDAIGEVPPSTVDVDAAIARGRRAARLRRVANPAVAAGVAVVLLTGAVAYTMTRDGDGGATVGTAPPTTTTSSAPPSSRTAPPPPTGTSGASTDLVEIPAGGDEVPPPRCADDDLETAAEAADRLRQAATDAVLAQRPDLQLAPNVEYPQGTPRGPLEFYQTVTAGEGDVPICDREGEFESTATTTAPDGDGNLLMLVGADLHPDQEMSCALNGLPGQTFCAGETGPGGAEIVKQTVGFEGGVVMHRVEVVRPDGTVILVQAENVATSSKFSTPATATAPPLSLDQLVAIATDPDMTLFP